MNAPESAALRQAMKMLVRRSLSELELRTRLEAKGHSEEEISRALEWLSAKGLSSDERALGDRIEGRSGKRAVGRGRLRQELEEAGFATPDVDHAIGQRTDETERAIMLELLDSKFGNRRDRARAGRFLFSRGFDAELIESVLDRWLDG